MPATAKDLLKSIDYEPLDQSVTDEEIASYVREHIKHSRILVPTARTMKVAALLFSLVAVVLLVHALAYDIAWPIPFMVGSIIAAAVCLTLNSHNRLLFGFELKLHRFAAKNGLTLTRQRLGNGGHKGLIFDRGDSRKLKYVLASQDHGSDLQFELGEYHYMTGSGRSRTAHSWTYLAVKMNRHLPHMVLDSKKNNVSLFGVNITNLPIQLKKEQKMSLEGDFDTHFTLYAPKEYERDALYVFTPDLMALLIDTSAMFDAEVVDDTVYFYSPGTRGARLPLVGNANYLRQFFTIASLVGRKFYNRTDYYADERIGDRAVDVVHMKGQRLKTGVSWVAVIFVVIYLLVQIAGVITDIF